MLTLSPLQVAPYAVVNRVAKHATSGLTTHNILAIRGGAAAAEMAQMPPSADALMAMMTAMSSYAVVGSLLMGSSLYLFDIAPTKFKDYDFTQSKRGWIKKIEKTAIIALSVLSAISIATALRTVIIFQFMTLYGNTALSRKAGEAAFALFWYNKLNIKLRSDAFKSFLISLQSFHASFALTVFLNTDGRHRYVATAAVIIIMFYSATNLRQMVRLASRTIYGYSL